MKRNPGRLLGKDRRRAIPRFGIGSKGNKVVFRSSHLLPGAGLVGAVQESGAMTGGV